MHKPDLIFLKYYSWCLLQKHFNNITITPPPPIKYKHAVGINMAAYAHTNCTTCNVGTTPHVTLVLKCTQTNFGIFLTM